MKFNLRIEDLEVRSCNIHLLSDGEHNRAEIVEWSKGRDKTQSHSCTLAYWNLDEEGYDLQFVGGRPFDTDTGIFMKLAKHGQQILDDA